MKTRKIKFTAALSAMLFLTAAFILFAPATASAQILKPGEVIYSRMPGNVNAPPTGANSPTIWVVGLFGSDECEGTPTAMRFEKIDQCGPGQ